MSLLKDLSHNNSLFFSSRSILVISIRVSDHLAIIILSLCQYYSTRLEWTSLLFRIITTFQSFYSILLRLLEDTYYLYLFLMAIHLGLSKVMISIISSQSSPSYLKIISIIPFIYSFFINFWFSLLFFIPTFKYGIYLLSLFLLLVHASK